MRVIGLWGIVFAILLGVGSGVLADARQEPFHLLFFAGSDSSALTDIYRSIPDEGRLTNLTNTPDLYEFFLTSIPQQGGLLIETVDPYTRQALNYRLHFNGSQQLITINMAEGATYNLYIGWSKNDQLLFSSINDDEYISVGIGVMNLTGDVKILTPPRRPCTPDTPHAIYEARNPVWSPDGEWIYYGVIFCDAKPGVYRMHPDGSDQQRILDGLTTIRWTHDGQWMLVYLPEGDELTLFRVRPDGSQPENLNKLALDYYNIVAVDDQWVYLQGDRALYRIKLDGSDAERLIENVAVYRVLLNGDWLYFVREENYISNIYRLNLVNQKLELLTPPQTSALFLTISPDNRWLYFSAYDANYHDWLYQSATNGSVVKRFDVQASVFDGGLWLPYPDQPWHTQRLALGAIALGIIGFILRRRIA